MTAAVHATALVVGTSGLLVRGASGSGKSLLARDLLGFARTRSMFGVLIGDDLVRLQAQAGRLIAHALAEPSGLIEMRNRGLVNIPTQKAAVIRLVVDFVPQAELERMPEESELRTQIMGLTLPRQPLLAARRVPLDIVFDALERTGTGR